MGGPDATSGPALLELRIHGVNNTSPPAMLDLAPEQVERVAGDDLGGFWRARRGVLDDVHRPQRGWTPDGVVREAYSWGGLARTSPDGWGPGVLHTVLAAFGRIAWVLLIPFGLANVAYWSRRLPATGEERTRGRGAFGMRLFGLVLTLLFVVTVCDVALDLVARQCYSATAKVCDSLPSQLDLFAGWSLPDRLAVASLVPVAVLGGLWWVTNSSRARYEQFVAAHQVAPRTSGAAAPQRPLLAQDDFWTGSSMLHGLLSVHLTASVAVVTLFTSVPAVVGNSADCRTFHDVVRSTTCAKAVRDDFDGVAWFAVVSVVAVALLVLACVRLAARSYDAPDVSGRPAVGAVRALDRLLLPLACLLLVVQLGLLVLLQPQIAAGSGLAGAALAPTLIAAVLVGLVVSAMACRWSGAVDGTSGWRRRLVGPALGLVVALGLLGPALQDGWGWVVAGAGAVALLVAARLPRPADAADRAWRGHAPAVFQSIGVMAALTLSSLVVLTTGDWLNGGHPAASLIEKGNHAQGGDPVLHVPAVFVWFGMLSLAGLLLVLLCLAVVFGWGRVHEPPGPCGDEVVPGLRPHDREGVAAKQVNAARTRARRFAAFAQRAELLVTFLSVIGTFAVGVAIVASAAEWSLGQAQGDDGVVPRLAGWSTQAVVLVGLAGVTALVGGKAVGGVRPLGLVWDLICFLPRAAHPLGPPCYAERAVPEITDRCLKWLAPPDEGPRAERRVVLSAHSLGSVLAVGVLLHFPQELRPMALVTYGSQLRAYFGRLFPELLGPHVLGLAPTPRPHLWSADPWGDQVGTEPEPLPDPVTPPVLLVDLLRSRDGDVRWRSLWRRTDYLGFPVDAYRPDPVDRPAEEVDSTGYMLAVGSHSDYPRVPAYEAAFDKLRALLG